ncbi:MAG: hypothetical protein K8J09_12835 [Planctomycetes bacterium]|nr:hypothetical protein [Planctomycetota bacterium]MCC7399595.1 hypothetical protein [Planctomycetota bacterium]
MTFLASLVAFSLALPQGGTPAASGQDPAKTVLNANELKSLRDKLAKFLSADMDYGLAESAKDRQKASKDRQKSREAFDAEWQKLEKRGNLVASMPDMQAIFENCFTVARYPSSLGTLRELTVKEDGVTYSLLVPKSYKETVPTRLVIMLPSTTAAGATTWTKPASYFNAATDKTAALNNNIFQVVHGPSDLEFDPVPDYTREGAEAEDDRRHLSVFVGMREVIAQCNVDRAGIFLDGGRGSSAFAVRFATLFPDRFAGVILRHPTPVDDIRLGSLSNLPILLIRSQDTAKDFAAVEKALNDASPGNVTVIDASDEYPFRASADAIDAWMAKQHRSMMPQKVVIEPNHDRFTRSYWAQITKADPLATSQPDKKPRLEVQADRASNRITVKAVGVEQFRLLLNDSLVDLDKEFTVVVNDRAGSQTLQRSFKKMKDGVVLRNDWGFLFSVEFNSTVAK